ERQSELFVVSGSACPDVSGECAPCIGHPAADPCKVEAQPRSGIEQPASSVVQSESAGRRLLKHAFTHQVSEHSVQCVGVAARGGGNVADCYLSGGYVFC